jgi:hypothetical protein
MTAVPREGETFAETLARQIEESQAAVAELTKGITWARLAALLTELVDAAETLIRGPGKGADKKAAVKQAVRILDERYHIYDGIDALIKLPGYLEAIDNLIIGAVVDRGIDIVVGVLNAKVWK